MAHTFTIIHTNDFHNHLTLAQAQILKFVKEAAGPNALLLDSGDAISAGNIGVRPGGEPILNTMNDCGYDAMTMGNREFHIADAVLRHKIGLAKFPILCANMHYKNATEAPLPVQPYFERVLPSGVRVGVIGVTVPMVTERMSARHLSAFLFDDPVGAVKNMVKTLRPKVDVLIALTHIGMKSDELLAAECTELDLIITGHTHLVVKHDEKHLPVPIVQAGRFGHFYGEIEMQVEPGSRPIITKSHITPLGKAMM